jgi:hypothetical protein
MFPLPARFLASIGCAGFTLRQLDWLSDDPNRTQRFFNLTAAVMALK